jgi:hypothetical protein
MRRAVPFEIAAFIENTQEKGKPTLLVATQHYIHRSVSTHRKFRVSEMRF